MANVAYHTHQFEIPTATEADGAAGIDDSKAMTSVATKAAIGAQAATIDQGIKADTAMQPSVYDPDSVGEDAFDTANHRFEAEVSAFPRPTIRKLRDHVSLLDNMASGNLDAAIAHREATTADATEITSKAQEVLSDCAASSWTAQVPAGLYHINDVLTLTDPITMIGNGSSSSRFQWAAGSPSAGGFVVAPVNKTTRTSIIDVSFTTSGVGVGTAIKIDYTPFMNDQSVRTKSKALIRGVELIPADTGANNGWRNGIETINCHYSYFSDIRFIGYLVAPGGPYNDGKAFYFHGESGTGYGPTSHYVRGVSISAAGTAILSENLEGVYIDVFDMVNVNTGIKFDNLVGEPGLVITNGHINAFGTCIDLNNSKQFFVDKLLLYQAAAATSDLVKFIVRGSDTADGYIGNLEYEWTVNSYNSTALQLQAGTDIKVRRSLYNIPSSGATSRGIEVQAGCTNVDIEKQDFKSVVSRVLDNGVGTTFEERWGYSGSLNNITMSSRRAKQLHMLVTGATNLPGGGVAAGAVVETYSSSSTTGYQIFRNASGNGVWRRDYVSSAWSIWRRQDGAGNADATVTAISATTAETLTVGTSPQLVRRKLTADVVDTITLSATNAAPGDMFRLWLGFSSSVTGTGSYVIKDNAGTTLVTFTGTSVAKQYSVDLFYTGTLWYVSSAIQSLA